MIAVVIWSSTNSHQIGMKMMLEIVLISSWRISTNLLSMINVMIPLTSLIIIGILIYRSHQNCIFREHFWISVLSMILIILIMRKKGLLLKFVDFSFTLSSNNRHHIVSQVIRILIVNLMVIRKFLMFIVVLWTIYNN